MSRLRPVLRRSLGATVRMITVHARSGVARVALHFLSLYIGPALGSEHYESIVGV